jgi:hypothetical protein
MTSALGGGWVVVVPRPRFTLGEGISGTHWTGGWVVPRANLDTETRGKILCPCRGSNPDCLVIQVIVRHHTDWATPAPLHNIYKVNAICEHGNERLSFYLLYWLAVHMTYSLKCVSSFCGNLLTTWLTVGFSGAMPRGIKVGLQMYTKWLRREEVKLFLFTFQVSQVLDSFPMQWTDGWNSCLDILNRTYGGHLDGLTQFIIYAGTDCNKVARPCTTHCGQ